jgi:hypothetical protein
MTPIQFDFFFNKIWEKWKNQTYESSARKAVEVFIKSGYRKEDLIQACETYTLETEGEDVRFTKRLSNFINDETWKDVLENANPEKLKEERKQALHVLKEWNKMARKHWAKIREPETYVSVAGNALKDPAFAKHWQVALKRASQIFKYEMRDSDPRSKILITIRWFCTVTPVKHTVLRLVEGEFGRPVQDEVRVIPKTDPIDYEKRQALAEELKQMFPDINFNKKEPVKRERKEIKPISEETKKILDSFGKEPADIPEFTDGPGDQCFRD